jgi:hypothetical protein
LGLGLAEKGNPRENRKEVKNKKRVENREGK